MRLEPLITPAEIEVKRVQVDTHSKFITNICFSFSFTPECVLTFPF